jgi:hypothetical protein
LSGACLKKRAADPLQFAPTDSMTSEPLLACPLELSESTDEERV